MPRGDNPNSKKALAENRQKTQFRGENAVNASKKGNATKKYQASFRAAGKDMLTDEEMQKMWKAMIARAKSGNISAFKMLFDVMGEGVVQEQTGTQVNIELAQVLPREEPPDD
jgi:isocitrate dehydrogenase